ncbi:hypothetical protein [Bosea sp. TND4EK4]|uniref:hypothetical protein n=1 Tax=Bosea sp. TND4EK4 TaxID=1907408 RepID=UPI0011155876|nr:hypothetical protein [Bosea sp. TND4EK4]
MSAALDMRMNFRPRAHTRTEQEYSRAVAEAAAARAVDDILIALVRAGNSPEVAKSVAYAAQEFLVGAEGYEDRARQILIGAGFRNGELGSLIDQLRSLLLEHA